LCRAHIFNTEWRIMHNLSLTLYPINSPPFVFVFPRMRWDDCFNHLSFQSLPLIAHVREFRSDIWDKVSASVCPKAYIVTPGYYTASYLPPIVRVEL
jgi:hypothetical protein